MEIGKNSSYSRSTTLYSLSASLHKSVDLKLESILFVLQRQQRPDEVGMQSSAAEDEWTGSMDYRKMNQWNGGTKTLSFSNEKKNQSALISFGCEHSAELCSSDETSRWWMPVGQAGSLIPIVMERGFSRLWSRSQRVGGVSFPSLSGLSDCRRWSNRLASSFAKVADVRVIRAQQGRSSLWLQAESVKSFSNVLLMHKHSWGCSPSLGVKLFSSGRGWRNRSGFLRTSVLFI